MKSDDSYNQVPCLCSKRWIMSYLTFFGLFIVYVTRVNMSVAILCMTKTAATNITAVQNEDSPGSNSTTEVDTCHVQQMTSRLSQRGEFQWNKSTRSGILAVYFYGYIIMQVPGGWLAGRYGAKRVWGAAIFVCALCTLLTPALTRLSVYCLYVLRFLIGFAAGVSFPSTHSMWGRWAPPLERSKLMAFALAGPAIGTIASFSMSGYLCEVGFDNGWGSIFYVFGAAAMVWVLCWCVFAADAPRDRKGITNAELDHIETTIGYRTNEENLSTPWKDIFTSKAVWALIIAHVCHNWSNYTLLTGLPTFMKEAHGFDIKQNGGLSSLPYLCAGVVSIFSGQIADTLRSRTRLSTATVRKLLTVIALSLVASFLIGASFITCEQRSIAVVFLCIAVSGTGVIRAGFAINHVDIAPRYAGILIGISNTAATVPGMVAPLVAGALTPNNTAEEWRNVFYVCAAFASTGAVLFSIMAEGEVRDWARRSGDLQPREAVSYRVMYSPKSQDLRQI